MTGLELEMVWATLEAELIDSRGLEFSARDLPLPGNESCGLHLGVSQDAHRSILLRAPEPTPNLRYLSCKGLSAEYRDLPWDGGRLRFIVLGCREKRHHPTFNRLVLDIIQTLDQNMQAPVTTALQVVGQWRAFLAAPLRGFTEQAAEGLFGELSLLERLQSHDQGAVMTWDGPLGGSHDFARNGRLLEVKTSDAGSDSIVHIQSLRQLDPEIGVLHLHHVVLNRVENGGRSLSELIRAVEVGCRAPEQLRDRLDTLGWNDEAERRLGDLRFDIQSTRSYPIDSAFPRITRAMLLGTPIAQALVSMNYTIRLDGLRSLSTSEEEGLIATFMRTT